MGYCLFFYVSIAHGAIRPPCKAAKQSAFRSYYCTEDGETVPEEKTETDERCRVVGVAATQTYVFSPLSFHTANEPNQGSLANGPRPPFSSGPEFVCLIRTRVRMSVHTCPNEPDYPRKRTLVRLKRTKGGQCECALRHHRREFSQSEPAGGWLCSVQRTVSASHGQGTLKNSF